MSVLDVENLSVKLGGQLILEEISLTVNRAEIVAAIGPNGAGKTTLLKAILGLIPAESGESRLFGKRMSLAATDRAAIGYVPQKYEVDRAIPLLVEEFIRINTPPALYSLQAVRDALREVDAERLVGKRIGHLSGGELQRVMLGMNLLRNPQMLFLDEPATGIDREGEQLFYDVLEHLRKDRGMSVLMISHDLSVVYRYADRVYCINKRLMCQGTPTEILTDANLSTLYGHETAVYGHHDNHH